MQSHFNTNELTQRDLQVLSAALKQQISFAEVQIANFKETIAWQFNLCDPDDSSTIDHFLNMNYNKSVLKLLRKQKNKLAEIQRKVKRQIANG